MNPTRHPLASAIVTGCLLAGLSACASAPVRPAMIQPIRDPARLDGPIAQLQAGNIKKAEKALTARVRKDPTDHEAAMLLRSLTDDPQSLLGKGSFTYSTKPDDSYLSLAQRYLGDRYKFYALMRYNGRVGPATLAPGTLLKIPGTKPREAAAPVPAKEAPPSRSASPSKVAPPPPPPAPPPPPKAASADPVRAARLRASGLSALNRGQIAQAVIALRAAAAAAPTDMLIKRDLARAERLYQTVKAKG